MTHPDREIPLLLRRTTLVGTLLLSFLCFAFGGLQAADPVWPGPASALYTLRVDGREIPVRDESRFDFHTAAFTMTGPVTVEITLPDGAEKPVIRPLRHKIEPVSKAGKASFTLSAPLNLVVQAKGLPPLALFATPAETDRPRPGDANVLYFGPGVHEPGIIR
ncbi:MAG TPA: hypothetical protein VHN79_00280, partial [Lacunisphaera sp.]|nr:hypothetical protein [Lacunisphaera sp.]